jgi:hypothetical protein
LVGEAHDEDLCPAEDHGVRMSIVDLVAPKPEQSATKLIFSARVQRVPEYSPDGTKGVFESDRSCTHEIWLAEANGSDLVQLTSFNGPQTGGPNWCSDGRRIALDSRASGASAIYVEDIVLKTSTPSPNQCSESGSSHVAGDCRWLFVSNGHDTLYRVPSQGGEATRVTDHSCWYSLTNGGRLFFNVNEARDVVLWSKLVFGISNSNAIRVAFSHRGGEMVSGLRETVVHNPRPQ